MLAALVLAIFGSIASRQPASIPVLGVSTLALYIRSQASASAQTPSSRVVSWALLPALYTQTEGKLCAMYFEPVSSMCRADASDPRLLGRRSLDGRQQWLQKLRMEEPFVVFHMGFSSKLWAPFMVPDDIADVGLPKCDPNLGNHPYEGH